MLDLFLFVLGVALNSSGGGDTTVVMNDDAPVIVEETAPEVTITPTPEADPTVTQSAAADTETVTLAQPEADTGAATSQGSWNVETNTGSSWISNRPETAQEGGLANDEGASLLAGVVNEEVPSLGAEESFVAEPQIPTGKFTTATEIKPILAATKGSWVALRDYEGQDYLYVTHIWAWRCGLHQMRYSINGGPMQVWPLPPCHENTNAPNAIIEGDGLPYTTFPAGSVKSISVELLLDDMSEDSSDYVRTDVLMPG